MLQKHATKANAGSGVPAPKVKPRNTNTRSKATVERQLGRDLLQQSRVSAYDSTPAAGEWDYVLGDLRFGATEHGRIYSRNFLHPGDPVGRNTGYPDDSANPVAVITARDAFTISAPSGIATNTNWNCVVFLIPTENAMSIFVAWPDGTPNPPDEVYTKFFGNLTGGDSYSEKVDLRASHKQWSEITTGGGSNRYFVQWRGVRCLDFKDSTTSGKVLGGVPNLVMANADKWRPVYLSTTVHFDAAALTNQGRLYAGQIATDSSATSVSLLGSEKAAVTRTALVNYVDVPGDSESLVEADSRVYVAEAKDGLYLPLRASDSENPFRPLSHAFVAPGSHFEWEDVIANGGLILGGEDAFNPGTPITNEDPGICPVTLSPRLMTGVEFWESIHKTSSLNVKINVCMEVTCDKQSVYGAFVDTAPLVDRVALEAVAVLSQTLPHAFPANCNDLGFLMNFIKSVAGGVGDVGRVLESIGVPLISDIAGGIADVSEGISKGFSRF